MSDEFALKARPTALERSSRLRRVRGLEAPARATIKEVAEHANVAISTVSRVVNGGPASELVRQRVLASIAELGYTPSVAAQSLVARRAGCIGLAVNSSQSPWFTQILSGIEEALLPSRMSVLLASMKLTGTYDPSAVVSWIQERRVDGLILVRYSRRHQHLLEAAAAASLPVVLIAPDVSAPVEFVVSCNNADAGRYVAEHLVELGHTKVAFAGGPEDSIDARERLRGLSEVLVARGLSGPVDAWFGPGYTPESGVAYAARFLAMPSEQRPTAVILGNDQMALGFMRRLLQAGLCIPHDVSVAGFDGTPDGEQFWPGLTTVRQPTRLMSARACAALLGTILGTDEERVPSLEYGVELVVRESSGPVPVGR
jgi:LacI family transcriptional regulator